MMNEEEIKSLVVDSWRLMFAYERAIADLPQQKQKAATAKARNLFDLMFSHVIKLLQKNDIKIVSFEGKTYEPNRPFKAVNAEDFENREDLIVLETLEPALVKNGKILHFGKVILTQSTQLKIKKE